MKPPVFTWLPLPHLPRVPEHFEKHAFELAHTFDPDRMEQLGMRPNSFKHRTIVYQGRSSKSRAQEIFDMGEDFKHWVKQNIIEDFDQVEGRINLSPDGLTTTHGAHVDNPAKLRLYYLLDAGGRCCLPIV